MLRHACVQAGERWSRHPVTSSLLRASKYSEYDAVHGAHTRSVQNARCSGRISFSFLHRLNGVAQCPLYPRKETSLSAIVMSALSQKQTFDRQFDHLVSGG